MIDTKDEKTIEAKTEIVKHEPHQPQSIAETFIQQAIDKGMPVEAMEKLLTMRSQLKEEWAREQLFKSLSAFQAECPEIKKDQIVMGKDGKPRYRYASLDTITSQVKELLRKHGFAYTFQSSFDANSVTVRCVAFHEAGHQESSEFKAVIEKDAYMGEIQKIGSALTYAKRYSFCAVFGIMTADEDTDATPEPEILPPQQEKKEPESKIRVGQLLWRY